ncbi:MAG: alkaline phosphatase D family protein, partial [Bacteroidota bacterium]
MRILFLLLSFAFSFVSAQVQLPANMYADSTYSPFLHGVASGDPTQDAVVLWTKIDPQGALSAITLDWEVATDWAFTNVVANGTVDAASGQDWTAIVDVTGLSAGMVYWYRFREPGGNYTRIGRTRTAPSGSPNQVRMAIASCSSVYSGFFNAYRRIGERNDLDLMIHLGDYIYDFVDQDEQVRVPVPPPVDPENLAEYRTTHAYYLLDPDLRLARQMHPWVVIWDNHDIDAPSPQAFAEAVQAFQEYVPMRVRDANQPEHIERKFSYGDLVDLFMIDGTTRRDVDLIAGNEFSMLGDSQWNWLSDELQNSSAKWRVIGNEVMMAEFSMAGLPSFVPFGDGPVADSSAWDGYTAERVRLLNFLDTA